MIEYGAPLGTPSGHQSSTIIIPALGNPKQRNIKLDWSKLL